MSHLSIWSSCFLNSSPSAELETSLFMASGKKWESVPSMEDREWKHDCLCVHFMRDEQLLHGWCWLGDHLTAGKKNTSHGNEMLPQDTTHLIWRPCYQGGSPCQDPAGNWTTRRPSDHHKEMQTAVVWSCLPFSGSGQNHLARYSERGKKARQTEEEVGR